MPTNHQFAGLAGSMLEIAGTFLLAVEAIKLPTLAALRVKLFERILHSLSPRIWVRQDEKPEVVAEKVDRATFRFLLILGTIMFVILVTISVAASGTPNAFWMAIKARLPASPLLSVVILVLGVWILFAVSMFLGGVLYMAVLFPFKVSFKTLQAIEDHTASGVVGILGFTLFCGGAIVHAFLDWSAP